MNYQFPKEFKWGSAVWAQGTEGAYNVDGKAPTVWDEYFRLEPNRFQGQIGPNETLDWYHQYERYIDLIHELGHTSFRTSILWARLIPDGQHINDKAVTYYSNMFKYFKAKGIELSITLYWFDMPLLYENKGGFTNRDILPDFVFYCQTCFELFDGLVDHWYIYNEPMVDVMIKYQTNVCYPNKLDFGMATQAIYNMCIAHAQVVKAFREGQFQGEIGSVLNRCGVYARSDHPADMKAKRMYEMIQYEAFEYPILKGIFSKEWLAFVKEYHPNLITHDGDDAMLLGQEVSLVGLNIYSPARVKAKSVVVHPDAPIMFDFDHSMFYEHYDMHGKMFNADRGWEIYPKVMYDVLTQMKQAYGDKSFYITENGIGIQNEGRYRNHDGVIEDDYRIEFVREHLKYLHKAIQDGVQVLGYNMWSFIDLWSPTNQFKNCYGFYEFDLKTKYVKRKKSADWFEQITKDNGFND